MALWMGYALLVGAMVSVAAHFAEWASRSRGRAGRHAWSVAVPVSVALPLIALLRPAPSPAAVPSGGAVAALRLGIERVPAMPSLLERMDPWLLGLWLAATLLLGCALVGGLLRLSLRARRWPSARSGSGDVLLSDGFGPALLGVRRPRVVVPRWALALEPEQLRLVILHEEEHRRAGDVPNLLAAALAVVAAPWNLALWWQLRRLRAAMELDCDARVLRRGASPAAYGALLLELGTRVPGLPLAALPVAALSNPPSLLERRLRMIVRGAKRHGRPTFLAATGAAVLLAALACETPPPTEVRSASEGNAAVQTDGAAAVGSVVAGGTGRSGSAPDILVRSPTSIGASGRSQQPLYVVDGVIMGSSLVDLDALDIRSIEVIKGAEAQRLYGSEGANGVIQITTKSAVHSTTAGEEQAKVRATLERERARVRTLTMYDSALAWAPRPGDIDGWLPARPADGARRATRTMPLPPPGNTTVIWGPTSLRGTPGGTVTVDGKPFHGDVGTLDPTTIDHIDVVKGTTAGAGMIRITTKNAARGGRED